MDLSKLPRLSNTPAPPRPEPTSAGPPLSTVASPPASIAADVWISLVIGLLLIFLGLNFPRYLFDRATGRPFHTGVTWGTGPNAGSEVEYLELEGGTAWTDAGMFFFGVAVVLDGIVLAAVRLRPGRSTRPLLVLSFLITIVATVLNLYVAAKVYRLGIVPLASGLAVAFGGYILLTQWQQLSAPIVRRETPGV